MLSEESLTGKLFSTMWAQTVMVGRGHVMSQGFWGSILVVTQSALEITEMK